MDEKSKDKYFIMKYLAPLKKQKKVDKQIV
jgi:hypothetical protein